MPSDDVYVRGNRQPAVLQLNPLAVYEAYDKGVRVVSEKGRYEVRGRGVGKVVEALVEKVRLGGDAAVYTGGAATKQRNPFDSLISRLEEAGLVARAQHLKNAPMAEQSRAEVVVHGENAMELLEALFAAGKDSRYPRQRRVRAEHITFSNSEGPAGLEIEMTIAGAALRHSVVVVWGDELWVAESDSTAITAADLWRSLINQLSLSDVRRVGAGASIELWSSWLTTRLSDDTVSARADSQIGTRCWRLLSGADARLETHRLVEAYAESQKALRAAEMPFGNAGRLRYGEIVDDFTSPISFPCEDGFSQTPLAHSWCKVRLGNTIETCEGYGWTIADSRTRSIEEALKRFAAYSGELLERRVDDRWDLTFRHAESEPGDCSRVAYAVIGGRNETLMWNGTDFPEEVVCAMAGPVLLAEVGRWGKLMKLDKAVRGADFLTDETGEHRLYQGYWMGLGAALLELSGRTFVGLSSDVDGAVERAVFRALCDIQGWLVHRDSDTLQIGQPGMQRISAMQGLGGFSPRIRSWLTRLVSFDSTELCTVAAYEWEA